MSEIDPCGPSALTLAINGCDDKSLADEGWSMVWFLSCSNAYSESIGTPIVNDPRSAPLQSMAYAEPDEVSWKAKGKNVVQMKQGYRVDPQTAPKAIKWESNRFPLPEIISNQQVLAVCDRFHLLVEQFEPDVHQFIPVDVYVEGQDGPVATYYWFVVCKRLDSVDGDHSSFKWELDYTGEDGFWSDFELNNAKLVFSESKSKGHHIWMDPHVLVLNSPFCSADFGKAALAGNFSGLSVTPRDTV
jgi:hypothetical protein